MSAQFVNKNSNFIKIPSVGFCQPTGKSNSLAQEVKSIDVKLIFC